MHSEEISKELGNKFINEGYLIFDVEDEKKFKEIINHFDKELNDIQKDKPITQKLNYTHNFIQVSDLNNFSLLLTFRFIAFLLVIFIQFLLISMPVP